MRDLSLLQIVHSSFAAHVAYSVGTRGAYSRKRVVGYELKDSPCGVFMAYSDSLIFKFYNVMVNIQNIAFECSYSQREMKIM